MEIYKKLMNLQQKLKAPKGQFNKFGNYKYRSCEDILEALKPLLGEEKCALFINDEIINIENRFYVKAVATLIDIETGDSIQSCANAREEESKKGMDGSQITGSTSSYARKYALNGLFCIDDNKDSDSTNTHGKNKKEQPKKQHTQSNPPTNSNNSRHICQDCGEETKPNVANYSKQKYNAVLCFPCQQKRKG